MLSTPSSSSSKSDGVSRNYGSIAPGRDDLEASSFRSLSRSSDGADEALNWPFSSSGGAEGGSPDNASSPAGSLRERNNREEASRGFSFRSRALRVVLVVIAVCAVSILGVASYRGNVTSTINDVSQFIETLSVGVIGTSTAATTTTSTDALLPLGASGAISGSFPAVTPTSTVLTDVETVSTPSPTMLYEWATPSPTNVGDTNPPTQPAPTNKPSPAPSIPSVPVSLVPQPTRKSQFESPSPTNTDGSVPQPTRRSQFWTEYPTAPTAAPSIAPTYSEGDMSYLNPTAVPTRKTAFRTPQPSNSDGSVPQPTRRSEFASPAPSTSTPTAHPTAEPSAPTPDPTTEPTPEPSYIPPTPMPSIPIPPTMVFGPTTPSPTRKTEFETPEPTLEPDTPTAAPVRRTPRPTEEPTEQPTEAPSPGPGEPTLWPTVSKPTHWPTPTLLFVSSSPTAAPSTTTAEEAEVVSEDSTTVDSTTEVVSEDSTTVDSTTVVVSEDSTTVDSTQVASLDNPLLPTDSLAPLDQSSSLFPVSTTNMKTSGNQ